MYAHLWLEISVMDSGSSLILQTAVFPQPGILSSAFEQPSPHYTWAKID